MTTAFTASFGRRFLLYPIGLSLCCTPAILLFPRPTRLQCQSPSDSTNRFFSTASSNNDASSSPSSPSPSSPQSSWFAGIDILKPFRRPLPPPPPPPPPPPTTLKTTFNPVYYRQISSGSFLGLMSGFLIARWSRVLVLVVGAVLFVVEFLAMRGIYIRPYARMEMFVRDKWGRGTLTENIAFKIAFGAAFAIAAVQSY